MTNSDSLIQSLLKCHKQTILVCDPPWEHKKNRSRKKRYKTMSLDVCRDAVIAADGSDVKEGGYSLPNEQVE